MLEYLLVMRLRHRATIAALGRQNAVIWINEKIQGQSPVIKLPSAGFKVCVVDPAPLATWPNNYGVWVDEFEALGLDDCLEHTWQSARVFLDSTPQGAK